MSNIEIVDDTEDETIPVDCPVCKNLFVGDEDINSYKNYQCCEDCEITYYYPNKEKWNKGWRPDIIIDDY